LHAIANYHWPVVKAAGGPLVASSITEKLRESNRSIWDKLLEHPFVVELYEGSLPLEKFKFYAIQDYNYLVGLVKSLSLAAAKRGPFEAARLALEHAHFLATTEMANYEKLLARLGLSMEEVLRAEPAPTNRAYVDFMVATCATGTLLECLVALLPCYWSYRDIALHNRDRLASNRVEIYRDWASIYLSDDYGRAVDEYRRLIDRLYSERPESWEELNYIFKTAARYEYMFWEMAYRMEKWVV
jgi:thiaminase/transcriptional activator TenA